MADYRDEANLREWYLEQRLTLDEIAEKCDCAQPTVRYWMDKHGIERRTNQESHQPDDAPYQDKDTLERLYHAEGMTAEEIGEKFNVSQATITRWMDRNDIHARSSEETREMRGTHHRPTKQGPHTNEEWLEEAYFERHLSVTEMAEEAGVADPTIIRQMDKHGLERRPNYVTRVLRNPGAGFVPAGVGGYEYIKHSVDDTTKQFRIHRLAAMAWFGIEEVKDSVIHHKDGVPWDNREDNLEVIENQSEHAKHHDFGKNGGRENVVRDSKGRYIG